MEEKRTQQNLEEQKKDVEEMLEMMESMSREEKRELRGIMIGLQMARQIA